jgi:hypothetical protein
MNRVGPAKNTNTMRNSARTTFVVDSHLTPRCTPENAEATNAAVSAMMTISSSCVDSGTPTTMSRPTATCSAPRPRLAAVPKTVANTASRSMALPVDRVRRLPLLRLERR